MILRVSAGVCALFLAMAQMVGGALAGDIALQPASPQPTAASLSPGLYVVYAYPQDVKSLASAEYHLSKNKHSAKPLIGFDYPDTREGDNALTARQPYQVAAEITGFIRFEEAGRFDLDFQSNDGLMVEIGGEEVVFFDGRHPCTTPGSVTVSVPEAGWYPLRAIWFQRAGTSCLLMRSGPVEGELDWVPNEDFAFIPKE